MGGRSAAYGISEEEFSSAASAKASFAKTISLNIRHLARFWTRTRISAPPVTAKDSSLVFVAKSAFAMTTSGERDSNTTKVIQCRVQNALTRRRQRKTCRCQLALINLDALAVTRTSRMRGVIT